MSTNEARIINFSKDYVMSEIPSYYAIIPATVRYDETLPAGAKLMYGEITALSNKKGYCFASNGYFAKLYKCTPQAISKWIRLLKQKKYVKVEYIGKLGKQERRVSIHVEGYQSQLIPPQRVLIGLSTVVEHNNIKDNNTSSNKREDAPTKPKQKRKVFEKPTSEQLFDYMLKKTNSEIIARRESEKFLNYYESNGWKVGRNKMKSWPHAAGSWLSRIDNYKPQQNGKTNSKNNERRFGAMSEENARRTLALLYGEDRA